MKKNAVIAIASGKGGTGKTTVAANLAWIIAENKKRVQYLDCDVEEPNGHIFLKPKVNQSEKVKVAVPAVDMEKCIGCGKCGQICQYGAIVAIKEKNVLTFEQLCHSCGGCMRVCPSNAIKSKMLDIGTLDCGKAGNVDFVSGKLQIGSVRTPALIKKVKEQIKENYIAIIDAPPGTSCPVVETLKDVDFVLLVTEPTPFGLNDLKLAVDLTKEMKLPFAVAINRCGIGNNKVEEYCEKEKIKILMKLPDDRKIAEAYSDGKMIIDVLPEYEKSFIALYENISRKLRE